MKNLALDIGDVWVGTALSDELGFFVTPYQTVPTAELDLFLEQLVATNTINKVIVGLPLTLKGTYSDQTTKVVAHKEYLEKKFPTIMWFLFDERLSSKQAQRHQTSLSKKSGAKEEKLRSHSIAAAFILEAYLQGQQGPFLNDENS